jgi:carbamoyltransferase
VNVILGLNAYHGDSAACVVVDGELVAAVEEERFRRIKHWAGFPTESIRYCLQEARVRLADVDVLALNSDPKAARFHRLAYLARHRPELRYVLRQLRTRMKRTAIPDVLRREFPGERFGGRVEAVEHHLAHLASAFFLSPWDRAAALSIDGFGDFASAAWGFGQGNAIQVDGRVHFPHSLGVFYEVMTQYLGFPNYGDEYKVMGLAPYGKPTYVEQVSKLVRAFRDGRFELDLRYFRHATEQIASTWDNGEPTKPFLLYTPELEELLGPARKTGEQLEQKHKDFARSTQVVYEQTFFNLLRALHRGRPCDHLVLSGGCAFNSVANGKITLETPFRRVYIQSAAGDAGGAVGAALHCYHASTSSNPIAHRYLRHAYLGPGFTDAAIGELLGERRREMEDQGCVISQIEDESELATRTAQAIGEGRVVGWFQGRMEWGPRALGNRSILGDPRRSDMKDILNLKIKRRESFRPFAPSILREHVKDWFEQDDDVPFMMKVFQIREAQRSKIPAVTHVDGSGRLQTVYQDSNPRYHALISAFYEQTGVPIVLNTSFNENEPVVCTPAEALNCFLRTKMDLLVLGTWSIERREAVTKS